MKILLALLFLAYADSWPAFRKDGSSVSIAYDMPTEWSPDQGIAWRIALPGYGQSSPITWKNGVYVTSVSGPQKSSCLITRVNNASGEVEWSKTFEASQPGPNNPSMSRAASTPVADAAGIYAFFESGDLVALDHSGESRWRRSLTKEYGEFKNHHGLGSSLAQNDQALFVLVDHSGPSYLLAIDKSTGENLWKVDRASRLSWTTPIVTHAGGCCIVLASSNGSLVAYNADDGSVLWSYEDLSGNLIPSPTIEGDIILIGAGESGLTSDMETAAKSNCAIRFSNNGGKPGYELLWQGEKAVAHHASPVAYHGCVYLLTKVGVLYCREITTGQELFRQRLDAPCWATPIAADGKLYFFGKNGVTTVIEAGPVFKKVATNSLWSDDELDARKEKSRSESSSQFPSLPEQGRAEMEAMLEDAVGDVVYGVAASGNSFLVRTGTELIRIGPR